MEENIIKTEENVQEETQTVGIELEDKCYRYQEMVDAISQSIINMNSIIKQQERLIEIVENAEYTDDEEKSHFEGFIKESKEQVESLKSQIETLKTKQGLLILVLQKCYEDSEYAKVVTMLSDALGIFNN